jgi:hypothetical protein
VDDEVLTRPHLQADAPAPASAAAAVGETIAEEPEEEAAAGEVGFVPFFTLAQ